MTEGKWGSILLIYSYGVAGVAGLAIVPPIATTISNDFHVAIAVVGLVISAFFVPAALGSTFGGWLIDRTGVRPALLLGCLFFLAADLGSFIAPTVIWLGLSRILAGFGFVAVVNAAPAMLMSTTSGVRRREAMSLWSTFTPGGWIVGFGLAATIAGTSHWRWLFLIHAILVAILAAVHALLPRPAQIERGPRTQISSIFRVFKEPGVVRLALASAFSVTSGLGMDTVVPVHYLRDLHVSLGVSSTILSLASAVTLAGGLAVGALFSRGASSRAIVLLSLAGGLASGIAIFYPGSSFATVTGFLMLWMFVTGTIGAVMMAQLPLVAPVTQGAAAAGLLTQAAGLSAMFSAPLGLAVFRSGGWQATAILFNLLFILIAGALPVWGSRRVTAQER